MGYAFGTIDGLGDGVFRKVRQELGVTAFGVNVVVLAPGVVARPHWHEEQDELYFVHAGTARFEFEDGERTVEAGGLVHVESTTHRKISNAGEGDLVLVIVGGKGGYVERDGHVVSPEDLERRQAIARGEM